MITGDSKLIKMNPGLLDLMQIYSNMQTGQVENSESKVWLS